MKRLTALALICMMLMLWMTTALGEDSSWTNDTDVLRIASVSSGSQLFANELFSSLYPDIKLEWVEMGQEDLHTKITSAFAANNCDYDLIWSYAANVAEWASMGYLEDITDRIDPELMADLNPGSFDSVVYKDRFYGLPRFTSVNLLWYNKALFEAAGLDPETPPATWDEFVDYCKKTTYDSDGDGKIDKYGVVMSFGTPYGATIQWELLLYLNAGQMFDENDNIMFNNEAGVKALTQLRELFDLGVVDPSSLSNPGGWEQSQVFVEGNVAMSLCWSNTYKFAQDPQISNMVDQIGWSTIPTIDGRLAAVSGGEGYVIPKSAKNKKNALLYLETVCSYDAQLQIAQASMFPPVLLSSYESEELLSFMPAAETFMEQAKGYSSRFSAPYGLEVTDILMAEIVDCLKGNIDPQTALDNAAQKVEVILEDYR